MADRHYGPGDLGRRLAERRAQLGRSVEAVATAAGMDPGYLRHLESEPTALTSVSVLGKLARALETTPAALLGAATSPTPEGSLQTLSIEECWDLLRPGGVGRVLFDSPRGPVALPVNFALMERAVVFRTLEQGEIATFAGPGAAGFEVDRIDDAQHEGWSVLLTGHVRRLLGDELQRARSLAVTPWAAGDRHTYFLLEADEVTGRRVVAKR